MMGARRTSAGAALGMGRSLRPKWHRLYYLLAAFDLFTVVLSLILNHETRGVFARSVEVNQVWGQRLADYSELGQLAAAVDAPGNDIFDSLDLATETARFRTALEQYEQRFAALREEVRTDVGEAEAARVLTDFDAVAEAMADMTWQAESIFSYFAQSQPGEAARRMATMDRTYAQVNTAMADLRRDVAAIQQDNFAEQQAMAADLSKFEYLIAGFILLMISAATMYGHKIARRVDADARERERYIEELRDAEARTRSIVDTAADGIITFDADGIIESANVSAARTFGSPTPGLIGHNIALFVPKIPRAKHDARSLDLAGRASGRDGTGIHREVVGRRVDGTRFPLELGVSELQLAGQQMFTAVIRDVTERKRAEQERHDLYDQLAERERRLQDLVHRLLLAQEEERRRMAYEVHDGFAQLAAAVQLHLEAFASRRRPRAVEARTELAGLQEMAQRAVREARRVIAGLRPTVLDDFGLAAAIRLEVEALQGEGWEIIYEEQSGTQRLPAVVETALYRVAQEALRNVRKHAGPCRVYVGLRREAQKARLEVRDWGRGFRVNGRVGEGPGEHVGIPGMQERIALLGGRCMVHSRLGAGTRVVIEVAAPFPVSRDGP
jgi:PAS domain S-box-containing protein